MKRTMIFLMACVFSCLFSYTSAADRINWYTNYDEAVKAGKESGKPLVLLFTGSDWCSWCKKLDNEVFKSPEFANAAGDKFIFVMLDFPINRTLPDNVTKQNKELQKKFGVSGYPTVVLLDPSHQRQIGTTGYKAGGGAQYAQHLLGMIKDHMSYDAKVRNLDNEKLSGLELKKMYERATHLGRTQEANQIVVKGLESDQNHFFMLERYRLLSEQGQGNSDEAVSIKNQLLTSDPNNSNLTHYQLAVIDFEVTCREIAPQSHNKAVASLVNYIDKFGEQDKENLWRLQMLIAQVYFEDDKLPEALQYAESSLKTAPPSAQPTIALTIKNIQAKLTK